MLAELVIVGPTSSIFIKVIDIDISSELSELSVAVTITLY